MAAVEPRDVLRLRDVDPAELLALFADYGLRVAWVADGEPIPGSFWGGEEAGLIGGYIHLRADTPLHSALHEACHWICTPPEQRAALHTDALGGQAEENATCYLQLLLAARLRCFGFARACADMDAWGYSFRLGSTARWFAADADDARQWLAERGLLGTPPAGI